MPTSALSADTVVHWHGVPLAATVGAQVVIMNVERGQYYALDDVASDVWSRLEQPTRVADLCAALLDEYDADPSALEADVHRLLGDLLDQELIETHTA